MQSPRVVLTSCLATVCLTCAAAAQSFNIDVGIAPGPSSAYGAGAGQLGVYNVFRVPPTVNAPMVDITGAPTTVTLTASAGNNYSNLSNLPSPSVDDISFMSDVLDIGTNVVVWTISNLSDGEYDLYVHAMAPDSAAYFTNVSVAGSPDPLQSVGGAWPGSFVLGITHAKHHVTVVGGGPVLVTTVTAPPGTPTNQGSVNGIQIVKNPPPNGAAFCTNGSLGTDHATPCPCGNTGLAGNGCGHSFDANGANLSVTGTIPADDIVLHSQFEPVSSFTLFMQHANGGDTVFHDGVLCAGNPLIRLRGRAAVAGEAFFPNSNFAQDNTTTLSIRGGTFPGSGATMRYAAWFRNASSTFCPPATANVTNGWILTW